MATRSIYLAPGASGGLDSIAPYVRALEASGIPAKAVLLPRGTAERALPVYRAAVPDDSARWLAASRSAGGWRQCWRPRSKWRAWS